MFEQACCKAYCIRMTTILDRRLQAKKIHQNIGHKKRAWIEIRPRFNPIFYEKPFIRRRGFIKGCK